MRKIYLLATDIINISHVEKKKSNVFYYYHRIAAIPFTILFLALRISAKFVSLLMIFFTILGYVSFFVLDDYWYGFGLLVFAFFLDKVDGDIARFTNTTDEKSVIFDLVYHRLSILALFHGTAMFADPTNTSLQILALLAVVLCNAIEEIQMAPYRILGQKLLPKGITVKRISNPSNEFIYSPLYRAIFFVLKISRLFRHQIVLLYIFGLAMLFCYDLMSSILSFTFFNLFVALILQITITYICDYDAVLERLDT